jgi:hypothetical protein
MAGYRRMAVGAAARQELNWRTSRAEHGERP